MSTDTEKSEKQYKCDFGNCTNRYRTKYSLKRHYLSHMGIKQYQCPHCPKRFSLAQYLQEHMFVHSGEKPFVCTFPGCGKRFRQAGKLSIHKKLHISATNGPEVGSQSSTKLSDLNSQSQVVQTILAQIEAFQLPSFFYSRSLPMPARMQSRIAQS
ncbi:MAG: C2H2-type zinc finger protein [Candidatus Pacebacteria bacterium]|nr:C2H2-type zinc finger protein [Candidatus Paceibacterota bacterium]